MTASGRKRRSPGEGGAHEYVTVAGPLWRFQCVVETADGTRRRIDRRGFPTKAAALKAMREAQGASDKGQFTEPSRQKLGAYGAECIGGMQITAATKASYLKNWRLHVSPYPVAALELGRVSGMKLAAHYRVLEASGRKDHKLGEGLSPRTVRYVHQIIHGVLGQAVTDKLLTANPAAGKAAKPPSAKAARAPEMHPWNPGQVAAFLAWAARHSQQHVLWTVLATTGMRRGEALALRWRDIDLDACTVSVRRSAGVIRTKGKGFSIEEGATKTDKPRAIDLDAATVRLLRAHRAERGAMALQLARDTALVFGDTEGAHCNPEHVSRQFKRDQERCAAEMGEKAPPECRLHDLRHAHATALLIAGVPVHVVSQRLGHANPTVTLTVYAHVMPGNQRDAADLFARLIGEAGA